MERAAREKIAVRAELTWDDDRRLEAETLGVLLPKRPAQTLEALRRSPQGCEWLMSRWALLAHAADHNPGHLWTEDQVALAFDLLGTPNQFRQGNKPGTSIDSDGFEIEPATDSAALARRMLAELREHRELVSGLDEAERTLAAADLILDDPELRRLRRYEASLHSRSDGRSARSAARPGSPSPNPA